MHLDPVYKLISSESKAVKYLTKIRWKNSTRKCPFCSHTPAYKLERGLFRCRRCRRDYNVFTGTLLQGTRLSATEWLYAIKLFDFELTARKAHFETSLNYKTIARCFEKIREAIWNASGEVLLAGSVEADESYFGGRRKGKRGRGAGGKVPVFGLLERAGKVRVTVVPDVTRETLMRLTVKTVRFGSFIYTDKFKSYDALMTFGYKHRRIDHSKRFAQGPVYINGLEGFWSFAKTRLIKFHGVGLENFPLYLKEMEFRYNNRNRRTLVEILAEILLKPVETSG